MIDIFQHNRTAIENYAKAKVNPQHIENDLWKITSLGEYILYISDKDESIGKHLLRDGYWEMWITKFLMEFIRQGDFVIDVGAHVGFFTTLFADLVGPSGQVHAFEPNPEVYRMMRSAVVDNGFGNTTTYMTALSDTIGESTLSIPGDLVGCASITLNKDSEEFQGYSIQEKIVETTTLDSLFFPDEVDLIKIDAEGAEEKIIYGAKEVIENSPGICIVMEWNPARFDNPEVLIDYLFDCGFKIFVISENSKLVYTTRKDLLSTHELEMLFLKR